jgi:hypothetical protein
VCVQTVSKECKAVIEEFSRLPRLDQLAVFDAIARKVTPADYGPLSDEDLTTIASQTFGLLDEEENQRLSQLRVHLF